MQQKRDDEAAFRHWVASDSAQKQQYGDPWKTLSETQLAWRDLYLDYVMIELGMGSMSHHLAWAKTLVRGTAEVAKPDGERLREFSQASLPAVQAGSR